MERDRKEQPAERPADRWQATLAENAKRKPGAPVIVLPRIPRKQKGSA